MGKKRVGQVGQKIIIQGDTNDLSNNEILLTQSEGYTILRKKSKDSSIKTFVIVPLDDLLELKNK